ncbi:MAG: hypothetical protein JRF63_13590, partial [Deltaproteobacteria bacterium]|nr:hypothetical protein [Deltaproteobacteria bacterium]
SNFTFSPDSRFLYGSTYYTGVSNIFRFEVGREGCEAMTNTDCGFFRPIPLGNDELIVFRYTGKGFVPARIETEPLQDIKEITYFGKQIIQKHPELEDWNVGSPADVPLDSLVTERREYQSFKTIGLESVYPVVEGYKDFGALGVRVNLSDPISLNRFNFTTSYTPDSDLPSDERLHFTARFDRYNWKAGLRYNGADFYDLFGPTKTSRKGWALTGEHNKTLIYDNPRTLELAVFAGAYYDIDQLPRYQNIDVVVDELYELGAELSYENKRASLGAVDHEKGIGMSLFGGAELVEGDVIPKMLGTLDFGFELPLKNSSIWLRSSAGFAVGDLDDPFANFFFGAFGNNYVDHLAVKRYRKFYAFPGLDLQDIGGRNFAKSLLEWNLPPFRFRRVGTPAFYVTYARASLFAAGIGTNFGEDSDVRSQVADVGVQIDFRMTLLSRLKLTLSLGYAQAFENAGDSKDEFMFSLKIL